MTDARPSLEDRLEFAAYQGAATLLRVIPEGWAAAVGSTLGWLAGGVLRIRREVVDGNLAAVFPDRDPRWRRRVAVASYRHLGREGVLALRLSRRPSAELLARTQVRGLAALLESAARPPGAILVTGHFGNWELAGGAVALRGAPLDAVAVRQRNRLFDRVLVQNRERLGMSVVHRGGAGAQVLRSVREGRVPVLLADQDAGTRGIFVEFLGRHASTTRGPAVLALRSGARLFGGACVALGGSPPRWEVHVEPLEVERTGNPEEDVRRLTQAHADQLARFVRAHPEQYFWQHKRWKTRPKDRDGAGRGDPAGETAGVPGPAAAT